MIMTVLWLLWRMVIVVRSLRMILLLFKPSIERQRLAGEILLPDPCLLDHHRCVELLEYELAGFVVDDEKAFLHVRLTRALIHRLCCVGVCALQIWHRYGYFALLAELHSGSLCAIDRGWNKVI